MEKSVIGIKKESALTIGEKAYCQKMSQVFEISQVTKISPLTRFELLISYLT